MNTVRLVSLLCCGALACTASNPSAISDGSSGVDQSVVDLTAGDGAHRSDGSVVQDGPPKGVEGGVVADLKPGFDTKHLPDLKPLPDLALPDLKFLPDQEILLDQKILPDQLLLSDLPQTCPLTRVDSYTQALNRKVDILYLVDPSGSMNDEQIRLLATIPTFAAAAANNKIDFHLGFISIVKDTSGTNPAPLGMLYGNPAYLTPSTPNLQLSIADHIKMPMAGGTELGFDALIAGLSAPLATTVFNGCGSACHYPNFCEGGSCRGPNWGFRRIDASLEILAFTDEDDGSSATVTKTLSFLRAQVDPSKGTFVRVHGLLPMTCPGSSKNYKRWEDLIAATGGTEHDLCALNYNPAVLDLTSRVFGLLKQFFLTEKPMPGTLTVAVNGVPQTFSYDPTSNSVTLTVAPPDTSKITLTYKTPCP